MAWLMEITSAWNRLELFPGQPPGPIVRIADQSQLTFETISGRYAFIDGVLHALYGSGGRLWMRIGEREAAIDQPIAMANHLEDGPAGAVVVTRFDWPDGTPHEIREPVPAWLFDEQPFLDAMSEDTPLWSENAKDVLASRQTMLRYWPYSRNKP